MQKRVVLVFAALLLAAPVVVRAQFAGIPSPMRERIARLAHQLGSSDPRSAQSAYDQLLAIGRPAIPSLVARAADKSEQVRFLAVVLLANTRDPRLVGVFTRALQDWSLLAQSAAMGGLALSDDQEAFRNLLPLIDKREGLWTAAIMAMGGSRNHRAVEYLIPLLKDKDAAPSAAFALATMEDRRAVEPLLAYAESATTTEERLAAAMAFIAMPDKRAVPSLQRMYREEKQAEVRKFALLALHTLKDESPEALDALKAAQQDEDEGIRKMVADMITPKATRQPKENSR